MSPDVPARACNSIWQGMALQHFQRGQVPWGGGLAWLVGQAVRSMAVGSNAPRESRWCAEMTPAWRFGYRYNDTNEKAMP